MSEPATAVGRPIPDCVLPSLDGEAIALGGFRGRRVALFMWASW